MIDRTIKIHVSQVCGFFIWINYLILFDFYQSFDWVDMGKPKTDCQNYDDYSSNHVFYDSYRILDYMQDFWMF